MSTSTSDTQLTEQGPVALPPAVFDLLGRLKELEHADGSWPGGDTVSVLCEWFTDLGVDPAAALSRYTRAEPDHGGAHPTVYLVQRDTFDGLYLFADPEQAAEYAALFDGADTGTQTVINRSAGAQLIIDSQPCPDRGDREDRGLCPVADPGCDVMGCQRHEHCLMGPAEPDREGSVPVAAGG
ncbi:MAG: hypothetical protein ACR2G2_19735 [Pseudonocardia sp.]